MISDVKVRKEFNLMFPESQDMYRRLVEAVRVGVYMADAKGNLFYVNHAFVDILGYNTKDDVIGLNLAQQLYVDPKEREEFLKALEKTGFVKDYEVRNKRKDGSVAVLSVISNYIRDDKEEVIGVEGVVRDITEYQQLQNKSSILTNVVEQTADNVMITGRDGIIQYVNPAFERTTGYAKEDILGKTPRILQSGQHDKTFYEELWKTILSGRVFRSIVVNKNKSGWLYYADQTITPIKSKFDDITHFVSVWKDITERMEFERQLEKLNKNLEFEKYKLEEILNFDERISTIVDLHQLVDFIIQKTCDILEVHRCSLMLLDEDTGELCIKGAVGIPESIIKGSRLKVGEGIAGMVAKEGNPMLVKVIDTDKRVGRPNRPSYQSKSFMSVPIKLDKKLIGIVNVAEKENLEDDTFSDLDLKIILAIVRQAAVAIENAKMYKELKYLTVTDSMTSLFNHRFFTESLDREVQRKQRTQRPLSLLMLDVDDFKLYNDTYGHLEGDALLKKIGKVLNDNLREIDVICRYAGDEFVVIFPETDVNEAKVVAEKLLKVMKRLKLKTKITVTIGVAECAEKMTRQELIAKADRALYEAKRQGKNCVCAYR